MKKCASCTKDLPEAALHCVFCGAKQPPISAAPTAKTAFGYSANEVMRQLGRPDVPEYQPPSSTAPYGATVPSRPNPPSQPPYPVSGPGAPTLALQDSTQPAPAAVGPTSGGMGINAPNAYTPPPLPAAAQPYLLPKPSAAQIPIDVWQAPLRIVMFIWGLVLLVAFATPTAIDPLSFHWQGLDQLDTTRQLLVLLSPAIGLLSIIIAFLPMPSLPRGILATLLGLAGVAVPLAFQGLPSWQDLAVLAGTIVLFTGLLLRNEHTDSLIARGLVTIGAICVLLPYLVPLHGEIMLVSVFKVLMNAPGKDKAAAMVELAMIALVVMSLLAWIPGPATGGAKFFAWTILLWATLVRSIIDIVISGNLVAIAEKTPDRLDQWGVLAALIALVGYGMATIVGRQLG